MTTLKSPKSNASRAKPLIKKTKAVSTAVASHAVSEPRAKRGNAALSKVSYTSLQAEYIRGIESLGNNFLLVEVEPEIYIKSSWPPIQNSKLNAVMTQIQEGALHTDPAPQSKNKSNADPTVVEANKKFMISFKAQALAARQKLIDDGALIKSTDLWDRLEIGRQAGSKALKDLRFFSLDGPGGVTLCPAFFSDHKYNRRILEKISKELGELPGPSKWQFFTTPKRSLDGKTPLEAIEKGQIDKVLVAATGFREG